MSERTQLDIARKCDAVKNLLLEKNRKYGDSALEPVRTFSQATAVEQILVRIDDKLSRISRGTGLVGDDEDVIQDLIGYLILLQIAIDRRDAQAINEAAGCVGPFHEGQTNLCQEIYLPTNPLQDLHDENGDWKTNISLFGFDSKTPTDKRVDDCGWDPSSGPTFRGGSQPYFPEALEKIRQSALNHKKKS